MMCKRDRSLGTQWEAHRAQQGDGYISGSLQNFKQAADRRDRIGKAQSRILFVLHKSRVSPQGPPSAAYIRCLDARPHGCWLDRVLTPTDPCLREDHVKLYRQGSPHAGSEERAGPITPRTRPQTRPDNVAVLRSKEREGKGAWA
jgi:hypothetical protein